MIREFARKFFSPPASEFRPGPNADPGEACGYGMIKGRRLGLIEAEMVVRAFAGVKLWGGSVDPATEIANALRCMIDFEQGILCPLCSPKTEEAP